MIRSKHATSQECWEWVNEFLVTQEVKVKRRGGMRSGPQVVSYDHFFEINKAWVDPEFDFGFMFGYKKQKWTTLKSNYIDMNMLDLVKSEVLERERKKAQNYNLAFKFSNTHGSGHGCLISLVFQRRYTQDNPIIIMNIRSSEVTKRLLMDFLLVQRMAEYIYGEGISVSVKLYCSNVALLKPWIVGNGRPFLMAFSESIEGNSSKSMLDIFFFFSLVFNCFRRGGTAGDEVKLVFNVSSSLSVSSFISIVETG